MAPKRDRDESTAEDVHHSEPIEDRNSRFIGAYSPSIDAKKLQGLSEFKTASHRILAWRIPSQQKSLSAKTIYATGHDDDGEQYAGRKLEKLLVDLDVVGGVTVARWYGGVLLGPVRFQHIEDCARGAIDAWRTSQQDQKRRKNEVAEYDRLVRVLEERDQSITILRDLLAEKTGKPGTAKPVMLEYDKMELVALRRLEKARDGSIAWILKAIDQAEQQSHSSSHKET